MMNSRMQGKGGLSLADSELVRAFTSRTTRIVLPGLRREEQKTVLRTRGRSHSILAEISVFHGGARGVIVAQGNRTGGWSLYVSDGRVKYCYNLLGTQRFYVTARAPLTSGRHQVRLDFVQDYLAGSVASVTLYVDDEEVGRGHIARTQAECFATETLDIGDVVGEPVADECASWGKFDGDIQWVQLDLVSDGSELSAPPSPPIPRAHECR